MFMFIKNSVINSVSQVFFDFNNFHYYFVFELSLTSFLKHIYPHRQATNLKTNFKIKKFFFIKQLV